MNRDVTTAYGAALVLIACAIAWVFFNAKSLADPGAKSDPPGGFSALPLPPVAPDRQAVAGRLLSALSERDIFSAEADEVYQSAGLVAAEVAPPVRLEPVAAPAQNRDGASVAFPIAQVPIQTDPIQGAPIQAAPLQTSPIQSSLIPTGPSQPAPLQTGPIVTRPLMPPQPQMQPLPGQRYIQAPPQRYLPPGRQAVAGQLYLRLRGVVPHPIDGVRALISFPNGQVVSAALGNQIDGWQIVRIGRASVTLVSPAGQLTELRLPGY